MRQLALCAVALAAACAHAPPEAPADAGVAVDASTPPEAAPPRPAGDELRGGVHVVLGVPRDGDPSDDHLIDRRYWVASYNDRRRVANWVAWRIVAADLGSTARQDDFRPDTMLPPGFTPVRADDYRGSGYDRGHLCPSADRTATLEANSATFLMTNMQPQLPELNRGPWEVLESHTRALAQAGGAVLVVAGPVFGAGADMTTIGPGIAVPAASFKVIVVLAPGQTAAEVTMHTTVLAVVMPNDSSVAGTRWPQHLVSVDEIERRTGYDLLSELDDVIEGALEAAVAPAP